MKGFFWRLREKYVIRDFHPLVFFYGLGILMTVVGFLLGVVVAASRIFWGNEITTATVVLVALLLVAKAWMLVDWRRRTLLDRLFGLVYVEELVFTREGTLPWTADVR